MPKEPNDKHFDKLSAGCAPQQMMLKEQKAGHKTCILPLRITNLSLSTACE
jgi:hypothetical protein